MLSVAHPDHTWGTLIDALPEEDRELRFVLPYRLGLTWRPDGGWGDYVKFDVLYDLVGYVADVVDDVDAALLERYRRAHHCAGYHLLLIDRVVDRQVIEDEALAQDRDWLKERLVEAMTLARGDATLAQAAIDNALSRWQIAVDDERAAFAAGTLESETYAEIVSGKVAPLWIASEVFLREHDVDEETVARTRRWFELILLGLQCLDDAVDEAEDKALSGASAAELLGFDRECLKLTGARLLEDVAVGSADSLVRVGKWAHRAAEEYYRICSPETLPASVVGSHILKNAFRVSFRVKNRGIRHRS